MDGTLRLVACLLASLPAGWFASAVRDRVPPARPLRRSLLRSALDPPFRPRPSRGYLTVQVTTSVLFAAAGVRFARDPLAVLVAYLVFLTLAVALLFIDLDVFRLPDPVVLRAGVLGVVLLTTASVLAGDAERTGHAVAGAGAYFAPMLLFHLILPRGLAFGDVKLGAVLGMHIGWLAAGPVTAVVLVLDAMIVGFLAGSAVGMVLLAIRRRSRAYPFGPFLIGGAVVVILFSQQLI